MTRTTRPGPDRAADPGDVVVDLFAGAGGWEQGLASLPGAPGVVGVEVDADACATAEAAGHARVHADVTTLEPRDVAPHGADGLLGSPPCQAWSLNGDGHGRAAAAALADHARSCRDGWRPPPGPLCDDDVRADLTLEPLRWAWHLRPRWVALEQVPPVLPLWHALADVLRAWGYDTAVAVLNAANHGVPQTRRRAILVAARDGRAALPSPTHHDPSGGALSLFGDPWRSMADALGLDPRGVVRTGANTMKHNRNPDDIVAYERGMDRPAPTVDAKAPGAWKVAGPDGATRKITVADAGVLQGFPRGYPWQGTGASRARQCGNAVPPPLAAAVVGPLAAGRASERGAA